jgi:hypothetical protein
MDHLLPFLLVKVFSYSVSTKGIESLSQSWERGALARKKLANGQFCKHFVGNNVPNVSVFLFHG